MDYINEIKTYSTGGGCTVDTLTLLNGLIICISDEYVGLYSSIKDMLEDDGTKCLQGFWINQNKEDK
jgi:hypothetical protein